MKTTAIITAFNRIEPAIDTIRHIQRCEPPPDEIIIHVDGNQTSCRDALAAALPEVRILFSTDNLGPGGARNKLLLAASHELVASFDDDSYPIDKDYFLVAQEAFRKTPGASIIYGRVFHKHEALQVASNEAKWTSDFCGGACVYRRSHFLETEGYVPVPLAYGIEEVDISLRLLAAGRRILYSGALRVFHDSDLRHHESAAITSASVKNIALLIWLRYPFRYWLRGLFQYLNRIRWLLVNGRIRGVLRGILKTPRQVMRYSQYRKTVLPRDIDAYFELRSHPISISTPPMEDAPSAVQPSDPNSQVTAIVTAHKRIEQTIETLRKIQQCVPPPSEIIVHVDANQTACRDAIAQAYPNLRILLSVGTIGPGGGRNRLIGAAANELVASFDDDSYPLDQDYFQRVVDLAESFPDAAIIGNMIIHLNEPVRDLQDRHWWSSDFCGAGAVYRRSAFLATTGYVPLPLAYGMEEVDIAIRLWSLGRKVLMTEALRVFHDTDLKRHADPRITTASIANIALLVALRYPVVLWPLGCGQIANRIRWVLANGRFAGTWSGIMQVPSHIWLHRRYRQVLPARKVLEYLSLRRRPLAARAPAKEMQ